MRPFLITAGIIGMLYGLLFFDVTVDTNGFTRVNNIGLMNDREAILIVSGFFFLGGILMKRREPPDHDQPRQLIDRVSKAEPNQKDIAALSRIVKPPVDDTPWYRKAEFIVLASTVSALLIGWAIYAGQKAYQDGYRFNPALWWEIVTSK